MICLRNAAVARANAAIYNQKAIRKELKSIIHSIDCFSKKGYSGCTWRGSINETNIKVLKKLGYIITNKTYNIYEIKW